MEEEILYSAECPSLDDLRLTFSEHHGRRSKPDINCVYPTKSEMDRAVREWLAGLRCRQDSKEQAKASRKGRLREPAHSAKILKGYLQQFFPGVKFSVSSRTFSMGDSIDVDYTDGPLYEEVNRIASLFQCGDFDGMTDSYNYRPVKVGCSGAKYVHVHRNLSPELKAALLPILKENFAPQYRDGEEVGDYAPYQVEKAERAYRGVSQEEVGRRTQERVDLITAMGVLSI